jgi:HEAT repeat protein
LKQALALSPGQSLVHACQLSTEEIEEINQVARQEQNPEYIYVLVDNLIEILLHLGEDMDAYENMISFFQRAVESLLDQGDIRQAVGIMNHLNDTIESIVLKDKQIFAIRRILEASSSPQAIGRIGRRMKENGEADSETIQQYLRFLTKQAVDPLCLLLGEMESGKWRRIICDRLAELSREDIQPLANYLSNSNPLVVCYILNALGKAGHPSTLKYLGPLITHSDTKVREETLQLIARFEEKGKDLLQKFLKDTHPDIRGKASLALAKAAKDQAVKPLAEIILSEDFHRRSYEEKTSFFRALGETKSREAVPILQKIAKKRRWFQRAQWEEMRQCASMALKMMGVS